MFSGCSNEGNEKMRDVDNTHEDSLLTVVGGLVMIPKGEKPFTVA